MFALSSQLSGWAVKFERRRGPCDVRVDARAETYQFPGKRSRVLHLRRVRDLLERAGDDRVPALSRQPAVRLSGRHSAASDLRGWVAGSAGTYNVPLIRPRIHAVFAWGEVFLLGLLAWNPSQLIDSFTLHTGNGRQDAEFSLGDRPCAR